MFSCICLRKRQQSCKPKIGGQTLVTTKLSSNQPRIKFSTGQCVKEVLCDIAPTNSWHLLLRWAWLHFKMLNLDKRSLCGICDMKWSSNLWYKDKPVRINIGWRKEYKRRNINCRRKRNWRKRKGRKDKVDWKGSRKTRFNRRLPMFGCICLRKRQQCCKPKIGGETLVTTKLSSESIKDQFQYRTMCERSIVWYSSHELLSSSFEMGMASF